MVLRDGQDDVVAAGDDDEQGGFFAGEAVFDEDLGAFDGEEVFDGGGGFVASGGDGDALARGEAIGFNDEGGGAGFEISEGGFGAVEAGGGGGGDTVFLKDFLGIDLRSFEAGAIGAGTVGGDAGGAQGVGEAEGEGDLGADDDKFDFFASGQATRPGTSSAATGWQTASAAMPALPGAQRRRDAAGEAARARTRACSRPPEPTTSTERGRDKADMKVKGLGVSRGRRPPLRRGRW